MRNIKLTLEYDGTAYCGFQDQARDDRPTIQRTLQRAIASLGAGPVKLIAAGRTDAGVHALGQVVNFHTTLRIPVERLPLAINSHLPRDIRVVQAEEVPLTFHARFDAVSKTYRYTWYTRPIASPFWYRYAHFVPHELDIEAMRNAATALIGEHDFAAFRSAHGSARSTVRRMFRSEVYRNGECVCFEIEGNGFLYNMVRIIAGTLLDIGLGRRSPGSIIRALNSGRREDLGTTAPAQGLVLVEVKYAEGALKGASRG